LRVVVFQPFGGVGHLDSWARMILAALEKRGVTTVFVAPRSTCTVIDDYFIEARRQGSLAVIPLDTRLRGLARPLWLITSFALRINSVIFGRCDWRASPLTILRAVDLVAQSEFKSPEIVFLPYLDGFNLRGTEWRLTKHLLKKLIIGIRFVGSVEARNPLSHSIDAVALLDEKLVAQGNLHQQRTRYVFLPDISPIDHRKPGDGLEEKIQSFVSDRKCVLLAGAISNRKSPRLWIDLIESADPQEWAFVQVGKIAWTSLSSDIARKLRNAHREHSQKFLMIDEYVSEAEFSSAFAVTDVVFAVYDNFFDSSNLISHAAQHQRPLLVASSGVMASRVEEYGLGEVCCDTTPKAMLSQLARLVAKGVSPEGRFRYLQRFNESTFNSAICELLSIATNSESGNND